MNLQLSLNKKWFDITKSGIKTEDYREITSYWCSRLLLQNEKKMNTEWWDRYLNNYDVHQMQKAISENDKVHRLRFVNFRQNTMTLGYPKKDNLERILILEHKGIEIRTGNPEWGAEPNKLYFVIKHGSFLNKK